MTLEKVAVQPPGSPTGTVLVALLPGSHGAVIAPLEERIPLSKRKLKLVLPPARSVRGKVTLGGKPLNARNNQFVVLAGYEGKGKLNGLLSVEVTPQADGSFELAGLTPGVYRVQAAMDGIWLSPSVRLVVGPDINPNPLTLNIGEPGAAPSLELVDTRGKPAVGAVVTVNRPQGPLSDRLWPPRFTADGAGMLHLPPLEAGLHQIQLRGKAQRHKITVPQLSIAGAKRPMSRIVVK